MKKVWEALCFSGGGEGWIDEARSVVVEQQWKTPCVRLGGGTTPGTSGICHILIFKFKRAHWCTCAHSHLEHTAHIAKFGAAPQHLLSRAKSV